VSVVARAGSGQRRHNFGPELVNVWTRRWAAGHVPGRVPAPPGADHVLRPGSGEHLGEQRIVAVDQSRGLVRAWHEGLRPGAEDLRPRLGGGNDPAGEPDAGP
jgi:hypothetical protein